METVHTFLPFSQEASLSTALIFRCELMDLSFRSKSTFWE